MSVCPGCGRCRVCGCPAPINPAPYWFGQWPYPATSRPFWINPYPNTTYPTTGTAMPVTITNTGGGVYE